MFERVPGTRPNISESHSEISTQVPCCIALQEEGPCWQTCCPTANITAGGKCDPTVNATSLPGCGPQCDQQGYQTSVFSRVKGVAAAAGRRPPHCMLFANTIYDWPFDLAHAGGDSVDVLDIHGKPHMESCDPGIFPSFFYDYGKPGGRKAYLDIIERAVVNGSADGVYADCYGQYGLTCKGGGCKAKRNGKVQSINDVVTAAHVAAYEQGKNETLRLVASLVGPNGTVFSKMSSASGPKFGGPFQSSLMMIAPPNTPEEYLATVAEWRQNFRYLIMGSPNEYSHPSRADAPFCKTEAIALFLLAVEPGMSLLCNGWSSDYDHALGLPSGPSRIIFASRSVRASALKRHRLIPGHAIAAVRALKSGPVSHGWSKGALKSVPKRRILASQAPPRKTPPPAAGRGALHPAPSPHGATSPAARCLGQTTPTRHRRGQLLRALQHRHCRRSRRCRRATCSAASTTSRGRSWTSSTSPPHATMRR